VASTFNEQEEEKQESFYQRVLKQNREPIFEKEIDLDEELRKLEDIKLNRQKSY
jgi:hypothetical protein